MSNIKKYLIEWTKIYIKSKDAVTQSIESIKEAKDFDLIVKYKDKEEFYMIEPFIKNVDIILNKLNNNKIITLIVFNSKENFNFIIENWKKFIDLKDFKIIFVNPFSEIDKKWIIRPYMHHKICDESSLKLGLKSMFDMVEKMDETKAKEKIKNQKEFK